MRVDEDAVILVTFCK